MDACSAESFLKDQVPPVARALIPATLKTAYDAVALMVREEPILNVASAEDNRGRLISFAVDYGFEQLMKSGRWPFDYRWRPFAKPTGRYLEVRLGHSVLTISQVDAPGKQPRDVVFRENARLSNEPFFGMEEFDDTREVKGLPHVLIVHGHQELNFAHLGIPHSDHKRHWLHRSPNLLHLPHAVPETVPQTEETDFTATLILKEEIEKWRRDNDA